MDPSPWPEGQQQDIRRRTAYRLSSQEVRRQENIERIAAAAANNLSSEVADEPVDPDWTARFVDQCKDVSNEELQELWAKLLSQEVTTPDRCHPSTLSILATLTASDARQFERLAGLAVAHHANSLAIPTKLLTDDDEGTASLGDALEASALGLMQMHKNLRTRVPEGCAIEYDGRFFAREETLRFEAFPLTRAGFDLYAVVTPEFAPAVEAYLSQDLLLREGRRAPGERLITHVGVRVATEAKR